MFPLLSTFFAYTLFGLLNSLHCLGMCGPVAASCTSSCISSQSGKPRAVISLVAYNGGRLCTYSLMGGILGWLGSSIESTMDGFYGAQHIFTITLGFFLILLGVFQLGILPSRIQNKSKFFVPYPLRKIFYQPNLKAKFVSGVILGFIPCGLTAALFMRALGSESFLKGTLILFFFGLGTLPSLFLAGLFSGGVFLKIRRYSKIIVAMGIFLLAGDLIWRSHKGIYGLFSDEKKTNTQSIICH